MDRSRSQGARSRLLSARRCRSTRARATRPGSSRSEPRSSSGRARSSSLRALPGRSDRRRRRRGASDRAGDRLRATRLLVACRSGHHGSAATRARAARPRARCRARGTGRARGAHAVSECPRESLRARPHSRASAVFGLDQVVDEAQGAVGVVSLSWTRIVEDAIAANHHGAGSARLGQRSPRKAKAAELLHVPI